MTDHPITPPPELVEDWQISLDCPDGANAKANYIAAKAARWGADQEFQACCSEILEVIAGIFGDHVDDWSRVVALLRDSRRPGLREQAIQALDRAVFSNPEDKNLIICALEALDD